MFLTNESDDVQPVQVVEWLQRMATHLPFNEVQHEMFHTATKTPGAGKWLIKSPEFRKWRSGAPRKLFCYGDYKSPDLSSRTLIHFSF